MTKLSADTKKVLKWGAIILVGLWLWSMFGAGLIGGKAAQTGA